MTDSEIPSAGLGGRVAYLRKARGITQVELATEIGIARTYVAGIERGKDRPGLETIRAIANFFKVSLDDLLGDEVPIRRGARLDILMAQFDDLIGLSATKVFWGVGNAETRRSVAAVLWHPDAGASEIASKLRELADAIERENEGK